jgi:hypothetical protein
MRVKSIAFICLVLAVLVLPCGCQQQTATIEGEEERANSIVQAITQYKEDYNQYPEQLAVLMPDYLSSIPKTMVGKDYTYIVSEVDGYLLCFDAPKSQANCCYLPRFEKWDCSFGE